MGAAAPFRRHVARGPQRRLEHPLPAEPLRHEMVGHGEILPGVLAHRPQRDRGVRLPLAPPPARGMRGQPAERPPVARRVRAVVGEQPAVARHAQPRIRGSALQHLLELMPQRDLDVPLPQPSRHPARQLRRRGRRPAPHAPYDLRPIIDPPSPGPVDHHQAVAQLGHEQQQRLERLLVCRKRETGYGPGGAVGEGGELGQHGDGRVAIAQHEAPERQSGTALERCQRRGVSVRRSQHDQLATAHTTELSPCAHHGWVDVAPAPRHCKTATFRSSPACANSYRGRMKRIGLIDLIWLIWLVWLGGLAACADGGLPTAPAPPPFAARVVSCEAHVRAGTLACNVPSSNPSARISADLVLGGQGTYVALRSSQVSYDGTTTFRADVTVQNLTALPLGTSDGTTVQGVKVFFHSGPTVTSGSGTVTVANADGSGTFTGANQPYFLYNQIIQTEQVSGAKTWQWSVPNTVSTFAFQVLVDAAAPHEHTVLRWLYDPVGDGADLAAVWRASAGNAFAVGLQGKILHFDGTGWTPQPSPILALLAGVWGSSASDVFAVGDGGTILHYDGTSWTAQPSGTGENLLAVWGSAANDVFAVGDAGQILHYNGPTWSIQSSPTRADLFGLWGNSASDVFAVGDAGTILHWSGAAWTTQPSGTTA